MRDAESEAAAQKEYVGPAFPSHGSMGEVVQDGMSLRDYFAAQALTGIVSLGLGTWSQVTGAENAYLLADAMLSARRSK